MNVKQQHIELGITLQRVAAHVYANILPEETDWILNKMQERYVRERCQPHLQQGAVKDFEQDTRSALELQPLIRTVELPVYLKGEAAYADFPSDLLYPVDMEADLACSCKDSFKRKPGVFYRTSLPLRTTRSLPPFFTPLSLKSKGKEIFTTAGTVMQSGLSFGGELYRVSTLLREGLQRQGTEVYHEYFRGAYYPGMLILPSYAEPAYRFTCEGSISEGVLTKSAIELPDEKTDMRSRIRLTSGALYSQMRSSAFGATHPESPLATLSAGGVEIAMDKRLIVTKLALRYIAKPLHIDLALNQSSPLSPPAVEQITDMACDFLKLISNSADWRSKLEDTLTRS